MEAIKLVETVTENGLTIIDARLDKYIKQKVEVIIFPVEHREPAMKEYTRFQDSKQILPRSEVRGILKGKVWMADDFDDPMDDLDEDVDDINDILFT